MIAKLQVRSEGNEVKSRAQKRTAKDSDGPVTVQEAEHTEKEDRYGRKICRRSKRVRGSQCGPTE